MSGWKYGTGRRSKFRSQLRASCCFDMAEQKWKFIFYKETDSCHSFIQTLSWTKQFKDSQSDHHWIIFKHQEKWTCFTVDKNSSDESQVLEKSCFLKPYTRALFPFCSCCLSWLIYMQVFVHIYVQIFVQIFVGLSWLIWYLVKSNFLYLNNASPLAAQRIIPFLWEKQSFVKRWWQRVKNHM